MRRSACTEGSFASSQPRRDLPEEWDDVARRSLYLRARETGAQDKSREQGVVVFHADTSVDMGRDLVNGFTKVIQLAV